MAQLVSGFYRTYPLHGPVTAFRQIEIKDGSVIIGGAKFAQHDFFKVNVLIGRLAEPGTPRTNADKPFEPGELIEFCDEQFVVKDNFGNSGSVKEPWDGGRTFSPFYWNLAGDSCYRVIANKADSEVSLAY